MIVLHVAQPTDAGVPRVVVELAHDQSDRGWDVRVACPATGELAGWLARRGIDHVRWDARRTPGPSVVAETRRLAALVRASDPDVVHLHSSKAGLAGRLAIRGRRPTVFQPHSWSFEAWTGPARVVARNWERVAARWTTVVVCVSERERCDGVRAGVRGDLRVVRNGVDLERYPLQDGGARADARRRLRLDDVPTAVFVGRLSRQKGVDVLLTAWRDVVRRLGDARLEVVGDGPERAAAEATAPRGVQFHGRQDDVRPWLAAADVVVLPSRWEGMPLVVLEAMACGRSVVATDVAGVGEAIGEGAGGIVPPEDPPALAQALVERLSDRPRADREGRVGRDRAERLYPVRRSCDGVAAIYTELSAQASR